MKVTFTQPCPLSVTPGAVARWAPLSMESLQQEYYRVAIPFSRDRRQVSNMAGTLPSEPPGSLNK